MKCLIVGSTSAIARKIGQRLSSVCEVSYAGRQDANYRLDLGQCNVWPRIDAPFDVVVHAAADFGGPSSADYVRAELVNAVGTLSVCCLAEKCSARHLVLVSSASAKYVPGDSYYGAYSLSKRHSEEVAQLFCAERSIALSVVRPTQVFDDEGRCRRHQELFYMMADRAEAGEDICLYGSNDVLRNYIHLDDVAEICARIVERRMLGTFDCAFPKSERLSRLASAAFAAFGKGGEVKFLTDKPDIPEISLSLDLSFCRDIDFVPHVSVEEGYRRIRQFRENCS